MTKNTPKDQETWKSALKELSAQQPGAVKVDNEPPTPETPGEEDTAVTKESVQAPKDVFTTQRRRNRPQIGNYHAPTEYDKESLEKTKEFIQEVYANYDGDSLEELAGILDEAGVHIHKIFYENNPEIPAIRAFYHRPIIVELPDSQFVFDTFYQDLVFPKEEPEDEETVDEEPEKLPWWKRIFSKS